MANGFYLTIGQPTDQQLATANGGSVQVSTAPIPGGGSNPNILQPLWVIDPVNGNDNNPGTLAQPVQTFQGGVLARWGSSTPDQFNANVEVLYVNQPAATDYVACHPKGSGSLSFQGQLGAAQQVFAGAAAGVVARNRGFGTGQILQMTAWAGAAVGQMVVNTTRGSTAWVYKVSGANVLLSQPCTTLAAPPYSAGGAPTITENNATANGDALIVYNPIQVRVLRLGFDQNTFLGPSYFGAASLYNLGLQAPFGIEETYIDEFVGVVQCWAPGCINATSRGDQIQPPFFYNCAITDFTSTSIVSDATPLTLAAGFGLSVLAGTVVLQTDIILGNAFHAVYGSPQAVIIDVCVDCTGGHGLLWGGSGGQSQGVLWSTSASILYVVACRVWMRGASFTAQWTIAVLSLDAVSAGFAVSVTAGAVSVLGSGAGGRTLTAANLDATVASGGFGGTAISSQGGFGPGMITNTQL